MLKPGIYEQIINRLISSELHFQEDFFDDTEEIQKDEASRILSKYLSEILELTLDKMGEGKKGMASQIELVNKILNMIGEELDNFNSEHFHIEVPAKRLLAHIKKLSAEKGSLQLKNLERPRTPISFSSLLTASEDEPNMVDELRREIITSDRIDMLVSFIKFSGIRLILSQLEDFTNKGGQLRIITTSYMGATDPKAIDRLQKLRNTKIKISYDTKRTRLHAKAYIFHRDTGFTTGYVGSSNLTNAAISSGLEWNVKVAKKELPETIQKMQGTFESYWNSPEFEFYTENDHERLIEAVGNEKSSSKELRFFFDVRPYPYQQEILDRLEIEREVLGRTKNLVVAATGTGKTVISAFDYKKFRDQKGVSGSNLLFIAHRKEILEQSLRTFRGILKDQNFGKLFVGEHKTDDVENLFMSIQSFNSQKLIERTLPDHFDFIVVDEFHHAEAPSYRELISYYEPKILLGLTATPERSDGISVAKFFNDHISAEIRLPEAIDRRLLSPFQYFGITDSVDLNAVTWKKGGYDTDALSELYVDDKGNAEKRASLIADSLNRYLSNLDEVKGIGFCVSVKHAEYMSAFFNRVGIPSAHLTGNTPTEERRNTQLRLRNGEIKMIFVVDIYNEGVDIPEINTILFLRPTQSLTVFIQQLGRGLRLYDGKECLTVLDFIGRANSRYDFEEKYAALVSRTNKSIQKQVESGFIHLPRGSYIELEPIAKEHILENIKRTFGVKSGLRRRIADFESDTGLELTLENFLTHYHLDPLDIYSKDSFSRLCADAGVRSNFKCRNERVLARALQRVSGINSRRWIRFLLELLRSTEDVKINEYTETQVRMLRMFVHTVWQSSLDVARTEDLIEGIRRIRESGPLIGEVIELLEYNLTRINFVDEPVNLEFESPLDLHCSYSRDQILVAMDFFEPNQVREGVKYIPEKNLDLLFVTLNKSEGEFTPTTMYEDYSLNETLFHWQTQSTTSEASETGQRYIHHRERGSMILLFVREYKRNEAGGGAPYTFLGKAAYTSHEGSNPMSIIWKLDKAIPAKFIKKTNKLLAE